MKHLLVLILVCLTKMSLIAQVTPNPKIDKKSVQNTFINKIEITAEYTVFHMQYYEKTSSFDRLLEDNPSMAKQLDQMGLSRKQAQEMFKQRFGGGQTISMQPVTKIILDNGQKFKFIKAVNIPVSPDRKEVEDGEKYFFKVYFEKIPAGYEKIDFIENELDTDGTYQFWNFIGIHINNPKNRKTVEESPVQEEILKAEDFKLYGKIIDSETQKPINAKIIAVDKKTGEVIDSLQTARTGKYEFLLNTDDVNLLVSSLGYVDFEEAVNLKFFLKSGSFEKDVYVDPLESKPVIVEEAAIPEEDKSIGEQMDETATTFKLDKVYFNVGQAIVLEESFLQLNNLVNYLKENPELKIRIEGHTDNQGDVKANQKLSLDRAYNVRKYLVDKGIISKRIQFKGYGSSKPVSPNDTEENRSKNRRVEYTFID